MGDAEVSATIPDWSREERRKFWDPPRQLIHCIRRYQYWRERKGILGRCLRRWHTLRHIFWSIITGAEIELETRIGGGLLLIHTNGIVIGPDAELGPNCLIFHQVTIGATGKGDKPGMPKLGGHVDVGAGAKILGGVVIGDHAKIGANAVVLDDVPPGATAVGIPARIIMPHAPNGVM